MASFNTGLAIMNRQDYKLSFNQELVEFIAYSAICFLVPFFIGHPQWVTGIIVNSALILTALNLKSRMLLPAIMLPSLAVLSRGLIFGPFTHFLLYMIPFIWAGNTILVYTFKKLRLEKKINRFIVLLIGSGAKAIFLFSAAFVLFKLNFIPAVFLSAMGITQFYTAAAGGIVAFGVHSAKSWKRRREQ
ncbi:hypothetical protein JXB31_01995 [Candidatus Woesearchaeota archaeon]|nr:hypothetical protein [Candidatus Woesearchaeota archaeon]